MFQACCEDLEVSGWQRRARNLLIHLENFRSFLLFFWNNFLLLWYFFCFSSSFLFIFCLFFPFSISCITPSVGNITDHFNWDFHKAILLGAFCLWILSISDSLSHVPLSNIVIICHYVGKSFLAINVGVATAIDWRGIRELSYPHRTLDSIPIQWNLWPKCQSLFCKRVEFSFIQWNASEEFQI